MEVVRARYGSKRHAKKPKKAIWISLFIFAVSIFGYSYLALTKDVSAIEPELLTLAASQPKDIELPWPSGQGVVGTLDDGVLAASSEDQQVKPIASMTKLITALAVLEKQPLEPGELGKVYTITAADVANYHDYIARYGSVMPVRVGQSLTQYHALQGLLLPSANNIADTLAINEFGSIENYTVYANDMIKRFGLENTVVSDASGFSPNTVSTPSDMFVIGQKALSNPVIAEIVALREAYVPVTGTIRNTNQLLADTSVIGLKTGTTDEAGSCLLFAFNYIGEDLEKVTVIGTVMGVPNWPQLYREVRELIEGTKSNFGKIELMHDEQMVGRYSTPWGSEAQIVTSGPLMTYSWLGSSYQPKIAAEPLEAPQESGYVVGVVAVDDENTELVLAENLEGPSAWWRLTNYW